MIIKWDEQAGGEARTRAAEYVRMSTEHQKYSTDNQAAEIRRYAERRGFEIVTTYADEGKSGLRLDGREALQRLLADIASGEATFKALLVYDVSRFGRFQDPDEAAHYELTCKRAGITVHYCAEQFENDGTIGSSIIKTVKRAMAGEYSRELSVKVFAGQARLISLGFRQGGPPGFGLRRMLIGESGDRKGLLQPGEHKSIATDRVILVHGPDYEVALVKEIYHRFIEGGETERQIADALNLREVSTDRGRAWTRASVHQILINEKYVGHNVWGRTSFKLKARHVQNAPELWVRRDGAFEPIVPQTDFDRAQAVIAARAKRLSDAEMLEMLRQTLLTHGTLSGLIIDEMEDAPSSSSYQSRFGSLLRAYALVGFVPKHDYRYLEINRSLRRLHPSVVRDVIRGIQGRGGTATQNLKNDLLTVNNEITLAVVIARCTLTRAGSRRWKIRLDCTLRPDLTLCVRMDDENDAPLDYYILPHLTLREATARLADHNGLSLDAFRFNTLETLFELAARRTLQKAA